MKWAHDLSGIPFPTDDPIVEAVRSASKRVLGTRPLSRKEPISPTLGHEIVKKSDLENPVALRNVAMYVLSFAAFLDSTMCLELGEVIFLSKRASWSSKF